MSHRERAENIAFAWDAHPADREELVVLITNAFAEVEAEALERATKVGEAMRGTEWDAAADWVVRNIKALKEKP